MVGAARTIPDPLEATLAAEDSEPPGLLGYPPTAWLSRTSRQLDRSPESAVRSLRRTPERTHPGSPRSLHPSPWVRSTARLEALVDRTSVEKLDGGMAE